MRLLILEPFRGLTLQAPTPDSRLMGGKRRSLDEAESLNPNPCFYSFWLSSKINILLL